MTTTPDDPTTALPGRPPVVDLATWQAARDELLVREKAHTHEGDAIAAARRRLPMVELDGTVEVVGPDGPVPFLDLFQGRDELVVYKHMWYDGAPHQGQCEGCTTTAWHLKDAVYLNARGVSFAILTTGPWDEVAPYVEFMGYTQPWYSVRDVEAPIGGSMGYITCFLRDGDRVFLTYSTTGRGNEPVNGSLGLLDMTPYGRGEAWEDNPEGWPEAPQAGRRRRARRADLLVLALGRRRERHLGPDQPPRAAVDPPRRDPRGDPRPARPPPLTRRRRRRRQDVRRQADLRTMPPGSAALPQLVAAAGQVGGLGGVARQLDGFVVRRARLLAAAQPAQQVGAGRMVGVIAGQLVLETVDGRQCHLRAVELGDRDGPVEGDDRRGVEADELVVEGDDLRPVGVA